MTTAFAIQELARQVRGGTIQFLDAAKPDWLMWAPEGTSNHLLWHAGHALWLQGVICLETLTGNSELPPEWEQTFGMNCRPVKQTTRWPSRDELRGLLVKQLARIVAAVEQAGDLRLDQVANARGDALAGRIIHGLHDEARHQGEMYLLLKLCRAREAGG
jgi:DinB superfamily